MNEESWINLPLRNEAQKEITCLAWRPQAGNTLAVGTK
jgi:hypothetical protein